MQDVVHFIDVFNALGGIEMREKTQLAQYAPLLILLFMMAHRVKAK